MNITSGVTKMLESLLKLKVQMSLAKGDYDAVKLYADQLSLLDQGMLDSQLPISEEYVDLKLMYYLFVNEDKDFTRLKPYFVEFYGKELTDVLYLFMRTFNCAALQDVV